MPTPRNVPPEVATIRARVAGLVRVGAEPARVGAARAELHRRAAVAYIERVLAETPPFTDEDRVYLARLLTAPPTAT